MGLDGFPVFKPARACTDVSFLSLVLQIDERRRIGFYPQFATHQRALRVAILGWPEVRGEANFEFFSAAWHG